MSALNTAPTCAVKGLLTGPSPSDRPQPRHDVTVQTSSTAALRFDAGRPLFHGPLELLHFGDRREAHKPNMPPPGVCHIAQHLLPFPLVLRKDPPQQGFLFAPQSKLRPEAFVVGAPQQLLRSPAPP